MIPRILFVHKLPSLTSRNIGQNLAKSFFFIPKKKLILFSFLSEKILTPDTQTKPTKEITVKLNRDIGFQTGKKGTLAPNNHLVPR